MEKRNKIIIIKGSPGVGKTYTARKLVNKLKRKKIAIIPLDQILHLDTRNLNNDKSKLACFHSAILVRSFLREKFDIIVEYTFDIPEHLEFMIEKMQQSHSEKIPKADIHVFHLTAKMDEVMKRNQNRRDGSDPMPEDILKELYEAIEKTAGKIEGEIVMDTTKLSVNKVVEQIGEAVK